MNSAVARATERGNMRIFLQKGKVSFHGFCVRRALTHRGAEALHGWNRFEGIGGTGATVPQG